MLDGQTTTNSYRRRAKTSFVRPRTPVDATKRDARQQAKTAKLRSVGWCAVGIIVVFEFLCFCSVYQVKCASIDIEINTGQEVIVTEVGLCKNEDR